MWMHLRVRAGAVGFSRSRRFGPQVSTGLGPRCLLTDPRGQFPHLFEATLALLHLLTNLVDREDHGRVIAAPKPRSDPRQRKVGELATEVHRHLPRVDE